MSDPFLEPIRIRLQMGKDGQLYGAKQVNFSYQKERAFYREVNFLLGSGI